MTPLPGTDPTGPEVREEFWTKVVDAAVELTKTELAMAYADSRAAAIREAAQQEADDAEFVARRKAEGDTELELHKQVLVAMVEVAKGSIERSRDSAKFVQTVAAALAAGYTTVLGLVFAVKDNPLPARGFIPTIFFGLAAAFATAYLAFLIQGEGVKVPVGSSLPRENSLRKVVLLSRWVGSSVYARAPFLRAAVVSLLFGVAFLPLAVIKIESPPTIPFVYSGSVSPAPSASDEAAAPSASAVAGGSTSSTSPSPSPSPTWPPAPPGASQDVAAVELYKAQLQVHVESLKAPAATTASTDTDGTAEDFSWSLMKAGAVVVFVVAVLPFLWRLWRWSEMVNRRPRSESPVPPPAGADGGDTTAGKE